MKTLDEVIAELEDEELFADALFYLKEYKSDKEELDSTRLAYLDILTDYVALKNNWAEQQENPPLTWDELKTLVGKPVWVELPHSYRKAWGLNDGMFTDAYGNDCITVKVLHDLWHLQQKQMGEAWQAYRKERE